MPAEKTLIYLENIDNTNDYLFAHPNAMGCYTARQTAGRGRGGRVWAATDGQGLALSLRVPDILALPLVVAVAVRRTLGEDFQIKWPNDILYDNKKIAGILCEKKAFTVAGIGVNLTQTHFDNLPAATSLLLAIGRAPDAHALAFAIFEETIALCTHGFEAVREEYVSYCNTLRHAVRVLSPTGEVLYRGTPTDIAPDGALLFGIERVTAGEIRVAADGDS